MIAPEMMTTRVLNGTIEGMALAVLVYVLLRIFGRPDSRTRFAVWYFALVGVIALPFLVESSEISARHAAFAAPITLPPAWAKYLLIAWLVGVSVSLTKLAAGLWRVHQLRREAVELGLNSLDAIITHRLRESGTGRRIRIYTSNAISSPAAIGFFRPAIVLPESLVSQLSAGELDIILLHELAHLRRWDDWTNLAQKFVKALFFFHPAVWWIDNRLSLEREMACDEIVVAEALTPKAYATFLVSFTEKMQNRRALSMVHGLVSRVCQMSQRVAAILDARRPVRRAMRKPMLLLSGGLFASVFALAPHVPQLVAFQSAQLPVAAQSSVAPGVIHPVSLRTPAPTNTPRAIPAVFHPKPATAPIKVKAPQNPVLRARAAQPEIAPPSIYVVFQQAEYKPSSPTIWHICIWQIRNGDSSNAQIATAIVIKI